MEKLVVHLLKNGIFSGNIHHGSIDKLISSSIKCKFAEKVLLAGTFSIDEFLYDEDTIEPLFLSSKGIYLLDEGFHHLLGKIESEYNVKIFFGTDKTKGLLFLLVDTKNIYLHTVNSFKGKIYEEFFVESDRFEKIEDYERMVEFAGPAMKAIKLIAEQYDEQYPIVFSHEVFGIPAIMEAKIKGYDVRSCFLSYEVQAVKDIVCSHPGHDISFYNLLELSEKRGDFLEELFGDRSYIFQFELMRNLNIFDSVMTIGKMLKRELSFVDKKIDIKKTFSVYRGIDLDFEALFNRKKEDCNVVRRTFSDFMGYEPEFIFLHPTRLSVSKGIWRDFRVLEKLDEKLDKKSLFVILGSSNGMYKEKERLDSIYDEYKWPKVHKGGYPDLVDYESEIWWMVDDFNKKSKNIKVLFVNQPGINKDVFKWPDGFEISNIINGSDVIFGQSIYEPYGVSQAESALMGSIVVATSQCGFIGQFSGLEKQNIIEADYVSLGKDYDIDTLRGLSIEERDILELEYSEILASELYEKLKDYSPVRFDKKHYKCFEWDEINRNIFENIVK